GGGGVEKGMEWVGWSVIGEAVGPGVSSVSVKSVGLESMTVLTMNGPSPTFVRVKLTVALVWPTRTRPKSAPPRDTCTPGVWPTPTIDAGVMPHGPALVMTESVSR